MESYSRVLALGLLCYCLLSSYSSSPVDGVDVSYDGKALTIDGERRIIISGSIHYTRSTPEMWPDLIRKAKKGGLNAIETYIFWNAHEPLYRQYDFSGNLDFIRFIRAVQHQGLYVILRIGPYVCAEWNYGGFPVWLHNMPNMTFRTNNKVFEEEMKTFATLIVEMVRKEHLFASQGGPIILSQLENEYGNVKSKYGNDGKEYINWCADLAESYKVGIPWVMCQEWDAPKGMINTCNGYYCDQFYPNHGLPKMWTENWTGWFKNWGSKYPHRTAEDLAFAVARFFQYGGTLQNYYMYHGGTNFGRTSGGPYIATSYDYDAPLDEYGNLNQPKWGHLKDLHALIRSMEETLTNGHSSNIEYGNMLTVTAYQHRGDRVCFFGNANEKNDATFDYEGTTYTVPAWSVSILPDCYTEVYNTARVNAQTSVMVKMRNDADGFQEPYNLQWSWRVEKVEQVKDDDARKGYFQFDGLLDQKFVSNDTSDYVWYMTSVDIDHSDPAWREEVTLKVHTKGHILHVFLNGKHVGSQAAKDGHWAFDFSTKFRMKDGKNSLSLLSVTNGLQNYGAFFDKEQHGILGPVKLIGGDNQVKDLDKYRWTYKVDLDGIKKSVYMKETRYNCRWRVENLPTNKMFVWYKTTFKAPIGDDPVVLDLLGMGKGIAWVNGFNIGRYWPSYFADDNGCDFKCDYRGNYGSNKCLTGCGESSQRWYHVPRSILNDDDNLLVLFEEFGGNPANIEVQTVTVGKACGNAYEGNKLELFCQGGRVISDVKFASFGDPRGSCGAFRKGHCESPNSLSVVQAACLGKESCTIDASEWTFQPSGCKILTKRLAVELEC